jgi:hypothetical protein
MPLNNILHRIIQPLPLQVSGVDYDTCLSDIKPEIDKHLAAAGGLDANRRLPIIGGDCPDLAKRISSATHDDVLPTHLKQPAGESTAPLSLNSPHSAPHKVPPPQQQLPWLQLL